LTLTFCVLKFVYVSRETVNLAIKLHERDITDQILEKCSDKWTLPWDMPCHDLKAYFGWVWLSLLNLTLFDCLIVWRVFEWLFVFNFYFCRLNKMRVWLICFSQFSLDIFSEKIALYNVFLGHYSYWLIIPSIIGIVFQVIIGCFDLLIFAFCDICCNVFSI
jgi:hypothetical protein